MNQWKHNQTNLPGNFTLVDIHTSFTKKPSSSLRLFAAVQAEEVHIRGFVCHFKIPDRAVPLRARRYLEWVKQKGMERILNLISLWNPELTPFHTGRPCLCQGHKKAKEPHYLYPSPAPPLVQIDLSVKNKRIVTICINTVWCMTVTPKSCILQSGELWQEHSTGRDLGSGSTVSHNASCLSLMRLKPVVRIFPSERNTALIGLLPSWTFSFTFDKYS